MRLPAAARPNCKFNVDADTAHRFGWGDLGFGAGTPAFNRVLTLGGQRSA